MAEAWAVLDRGVPDASSTEDLPTVLAAEIDAVAGRSDPWTEARAGVHPGVRARALVQAGDHAAARRVIAGLDGTTWTPQGMAATVWAVSRVGAASGLVDELQVLVSAHPDGFLCDDGVPLGPRDGVAGLLHAVRGDVGRAAACLERAAAVGDLRAPVWGARSRLELARVLGDEADRADERSRALTSARLFFAAGGYRHLTEVAAGLDRPPDPVDAAAPGLGHLVPGPPWQGGFGVQPAVPLPEGRGMVALHHLLRNRHRAVPAVELDAVVDGAVADPAELLGLDPRAVDLEAVVAADGALGDRVRARIMDDRARTRVSKLVRRTVDRVGERHALLGRHLAATVRTGFLCRYDGGPTVVWRL